MTWRAESALGPYTLTMLRLGILGAGTIGYRIAQAAVNGEIPYQLTALLDPSHAAQNRVYALQHDVQMVPNQNELLAGCQVVVEAAAVSAVQPLIAMARERWQVWGAANSRRDQANGCMSWSGLGRLYYSNAKSQADKAITAQHIIIMSVGGLLDFDSNADGPVIHAPAGALGGLDAIQALAIGGLDEVTLTSRKPPAGLGMDVTEETVVFEGSAREVIAKYPKNVNVAVALSLAGIGPDRTRCRLVADPGITRNTHHVLARGAAGEVEFISRNVPSPDNPATSYLAALSAIALLKKLASKLQVG
jgi:predicted dinucleotide-utilizing enzyme